MSLSKMTTPLSGKAGGKIRWDKRLEFPIHWAWFTWFTWFKKCFNFETITYNIRLWCLKSWHCNIYDCNPGPCPGRKVGGGSTPPCLWLAYSNVFPNFYQSSIFLPKFYPIRSKAGAGLCPSRVGEGMQRTVECNAHAPNISCSQSALLWLVSLFRCTISHVIYLYIYKSPQPSVHIYIYKHFHMLWYIFFS